MPPFRSNSKHYPAIFMGFTSDINHSPTPHLESSKAYIAVRSNTMHFITIETACVATYFTVLSCAEVKIQSGCTSNFRYVPTWCGQEISIYVILCQGSIAMLYLYE